MGVRAYLRSPVALAWTVVGIVAVGAVGVSGWQFAFFVATRTTLADPMFLGGLGWILIVCVTGSVVLAVGWSVWLPCSAAIAYAVGRGVRGRPPRFSETVGVVGARIEPLYRWTKTRASIDPIAVRILGEHDVAPGEVAVGCDGFVVPAIVLDAPTLPSAVERANRVVPRPGRRRLRLAGLASTAILAVAAWGIGVALGPPLPGGAVSIWIFAGCVGVVGLVVTAAIDTAWRAGVYATSDLDDGFSR